MQMHHNRGRELANCGADHPVYSIDEMATFTVQRSEENHNLTSAPSIVVTDLCHSDINIFRPSTDARSCTNHSRSGSIRQNGYRTWIAGSDTRSDMLYHAGLDRETQKVCFCRCF